MDKAKPASGRLAPPDVLLNGCRPDPDGHFPIAALRSGLNEITMNGHGCTVADLFLSCETGL